MNLRRARRRDLRLVPAAVGAWVAALGGASAASAAGVSALIVWALCLAALVTAARSPRSGIRATAGVAALSCAAAAAVLSHLALAQPGRGVAHLEVDGGRALRVVAIVTGKVEPSGAGLGFDAIAERIMIGRDTHIVSLPVTVRSTGAAAEGRDALAPGARVEITGTAFRADAGERAVLVVRAADGMRVIDPPRGGLQTAADLRRSLVGVASGLPPPGGGLVPGLAVGDTAAVGEQLDAAMKASSLSHLTAVSGANCALVVGIAFAAAAACGVRRGVRVGCGLGALAGFVVLVTPEPSVVRAAVMAAIAMLGVLLGRVGAGMSVLSLAVIVLLVADPWLAGEIGFALSAAATGSLLLLSGPLADGIARWMPRPLALALAVPLAAQLACGPLLILVEPTVPLYGVVANLLAAPAAPVATVVGLAACLAAPLPVLQAGLAAIAWVPASWIAGTASTFSGLPGAAVPWIEGGAGVGALALVGAAVVAVCLVPGTTARARVGRRVAAVGLAGLTGVGIGSALLAGVAAPATTPGGWTIAACDVGQGDAVLVRSGGAVALIDAGPDPQPLTACLRRLGVDRVDLLVLTHFDADHVAGVSAVTGRVDTVVHGPVPDAAASQVLQVLAAGGAQVAVGSVGVGGELGDASWRVLWPPARSVAFPSGNDASVVIEVTVPQTASALFLGDLSEQPQHALAASGVLLARYDVVKVAHHGSADQAERLYRQLRPALALVTVGDNDYGHPRAEILDLLEHGGAVIARTDRDGIVTVMVRDGELAVWREHASDGVDAPG